MGEVRLTKAGGGLYERLLQRLALALAEAENIGRVSAEPPSELELRDLTSAELELIRAYLEHDLNWLRGWHAAAQELAVIEQWPARTIKPSRSTLRFTSKSPARAKPLTKQRVELCCALCGVAVRWQPRQGVQACMTCGSQLFRARNPR